MIRIYNYLHSLHLHEARTRFICLSPHICINMKCFQFLNYDLIEFYLKMIIVIRNALHNDIVETSINQIAYRDRSIKNNVYL